MGPSYALAAQLMEGSTVALSESSSNALSSGKRKLDTVENSNEPPNASSVKRSKRSPPSAEDLEALRIANAVLAKADATLANGSSTFPGKIADLEAIKIPFNLDEVFCLPKSEIQALLSSSPGLAISPPPRTIFVRKTPFGILYRCSNEGAVQIMPAETNPSSDSQRFIPYLAWEFELALHEGKGDVDGFQEAGKNKGNLGGELVYLGEYKFEISHQGKEASRSTKLDILRMRARIALRRDGILPAADKDTEHKLVGEEMAKMRKKQGRTVYEGYIVQALRQVLQYFAMDARKQEKRKAYASRDSEPQTASSEPTKLPVVENRSNGAPLEVASGQM
ncbi:hypothetical protein NMY22_g2817 [Coprinellus aureogranulatus]|nr:hypothetical protein NMY22_g2817 [Coprinellus aureogranulatus]